MKVSFSEDVKFQSLHANLLTQACEMSVRCTINGESLCMFTKNTWMDDSGALCHITNDDTGMYSATKMDKMVQVSLGNMKAMKKVNYM